MARGVIALQDHRNEGKNQKNTNAHKKREQIDRFSKFYTLMHNYKRTTAFMNGTNMAINSPSDELIVCVTKSSNFKYTKRSEKRNNSKHQCTRQPEKPNRIH